MLETPADISETSKKLPSLRSWAAAAAQFLDRSEKVDLLFIYLASDTGGEGALAFSPKGRNSRDLPIHLIIGLEELD